MGAVTATRGAGGAQEATLEPVEALADAARSAHSLAARHCQPAEGADPGCAWYHGSWPVLRALGLFHSLRSDDDFLVPAIAAAIRDGARRVLVSGAADAGILARVLAACPAGVTLDITVLDRCGTPLELNRRYAARFGLDIATLREDILGHAPARPYDLVCTHSFLTFFDADDRQRLVRRWFELLTPGGSVVTAQRVRPGEKELITRYPQAEVAALADHAEHLAEVAGAGIGVAPERARQLALAYASLHRTHLIENADLLRAPFDAAGFELRTFAPPAADAPIADRPGAPGNAQACRWRIHARKPH
jgi:SAM-dependent methyltransferase